MNNTIQLIVLDNKSGQPQKIETLEAGGALDMTSPLQRQIYVNTINRLTPNTEVSYEDDNDIITINLNKKVVASEIQMHTQIFESIEEDEEEVVEDTDDAVSD